MARSRDAAKRQRASWSPTFVVGVRPFVFNATHRSELLRNADLIQDDKGKRYLEDIAVAAGAYLAESRAIATERPGHVRSRLRALRRLVASALQVARDLPLTAEELFKIDPETYVRRYPDAGLMAVLNDVDEALSAASTWADAKLVDYPRRWLVLGIASALQEAGKRPTASSKGSLARCTETVLDALERRLNAGAGMERIYRIALKNLRDKTTQGKPPG